MNNFTPYITLVIGSAFLLFGLLKTDKKAKLRQTGQKVEGIVFDKQRADRLPVSTELIDDLQDFSDKIIIRFVTDELLWVTAPMNQDFQVLFPFQYKPGDKVTVYYDKDNPNIFYVDSKQSAIIGRLAMLVIGIGLIVTGLSML